MRPQRLLHVITSGGSCATAERVLQAPPARSTCNRHALYAWSATAEAAWRRDGYWPAWRREMATRGRCGRWAPTAALGSGFGAWRGDYAGITTDDGAKLIVGAGRRPVLDLEYCPAPVAAPGSCPTCEGTGKLVAIVGSVAGG